MKLFIQIPCYNEEHTLPAVVADLPPQIKDVDEIFLLVIDDGSSDRTFDVAKSLGVDYIVQNGRNLGLAKSYARGLEACVHLGADIIVNTDGDNQYCGKDIEKLVAVLIDRHADIVIGVRDIKGHSEFSTSKKFLQVVGSKVVQFMSGTNVPDPTSGFRALTKSAALKLFVMNTFSYTLETLVQAGRSGMNIQTVPIETNPKLRESRLFSSNFEFVLKQMITIIKVYLFYSPIRFFFLLASITFTAAFILFLRIIYYLYFIGPEAAKLKHGSESLFVFFIFTTCLLVVSGLLGSVLSGLRLLVLDVRGRIKEIENRLKKTPLDFSIWHNPLNGK